MLSLLDLAGRGASTWYVVYIAKEENPRWWNRWLKPGFKHVQLWRPFYYGGHTDLLWLVVDPGLEHVDSRIDGDPSPPWEREASATIQRVEIAVRPRVVRQWLHVGPITCVEMAKAYLGINSWLIRTPWQLFKFIRRHGCVLVLR